MKRGLLIVTGIFCGFMMCMAPARANETGQEALYTSDESIEEATDGFRYIHDPRLNSRAMSDIVVNPEAIYGFSPDPQSERLGAFASYDWSDPTVVEAARQERIEYLADFDRMYDLWENMEAEGKPVEEIARAVSALRNQIRLEAYADDPEGLQIVMQSNLDKYGNEYGPTPESLYEQYGSWETVLIKAFSSNAGMDACLGLYDVQYDHNMLVRNVVENDTIMYTVREGDYLVKIARKYFGDEAAWRQIYNANADVIGDGYIIYVGETLIIP